MIRKQRPFIATGAGGLEQIIADEIKLLGGQDINIGVGSIYFNGTLETAYRACLWSRFATRILMPLGEFPAEDTDALYKAAAGIDWNEHITPHGTFAVECVLRTSSIRHSQYAGLRVKDAIVDQFRERFSVRPSIDVKQPDVWVHVLIENNMATVCLDFAGASLHRRGYRRMGGEAPLKETLAAALVCLLGWHRELSAASILLDPMCGSATMLIEAAMIFGDVAPGLGREYFGFLKWRGHNQRIWKKLLAEAEVRKQKGLDQTWPRIIGYDASPTAVRGALSNIKEAGLNGVVHVERRELATLSNPLQKKTDAPAAPRFILVNPPYGERLEAADAVPYLYRCLGRKLREEFGSWRGGVFMNDGALDQELGIDQVTQHRLYNGPIPCVFKIFNIHSFVDGRPAQAWPEAMRRYHKQEEFANRLQKNVKKISGWAQREGITCFRVYDADIPAYNTAIDIYGNMVHLQEYAAPSDIDPEKAAQRMEHMINAIKEVMAIPNERIFIKVRQKQKGKAQYNKINYSGRLFEVQEHGCRFLVNLTDYLDSGLFLDHRSTRCMIQAKAKNKRFLNLFGYTGTATVHAAMGGAITSTTVDLSSVYLKWAHCNLALNGFSEENHALVRANCMDWLSRTHEQFDLIFADPPTFSRSKTSQGVFVVQQDHVDLIKLAMRRLERTGSLIFSTNFRRFKMDRGALSDFIIEDISARTIPRDFERNPRIHQCWLIRWRTEGKRKE